jgi:uncharacterized protein (DUF58 family)
VTSEGWLLLLGLLLVVGALVHHPLLFLFAATALLVALVSWAWQRYCFYGVTYRRGLSQKRAFFGEEIFLTLELVNRKLLPLPWLEIEDEVPDGLTYPSARLAASFKPKRRTLVHLCSPRWYERVRRRYKIACTQRGVHEFGPATLRAGDLFGMAIERRDEPGVDRLIVYPKIVPLERLGLPVQGPFGDLVKPRALWEDPTYVAGVRGYQPGDPPRRVHWKASARLGRLQTKLLDPTTHPQLALFLDMQTLAGHAWWAGYDPFLVELAILVAASIAAWAADSKLPVGLHVNGHRFREGPSRIALPPSEHPEQLRAILEALAAVVPIAMVPLDEVILAEAPTLSSGTTVLVITAIADRALVAALHALRRQGWSIGLVVVGKRASIVPLDGIPVFHISGEESWREIASVALG